MFNYDKLEDAIAKSGKTKAFLCEKMGRPRYYLRDVVRQKNKITPENQQILADELGVTVDWLNDISDVKTDTLEQLKDDERTLLHSYRTMTDEQKMMMEIFIKGLKND